MLKLPLYDYQHKAIQWMQHHEEQIQHEPQHPSLIDANNPSNVQINGGFLSMKMGLGKTIISLMVANQPNETTLVVCPKSALVTWKTEIQKFFNDDFPCLIVSEYISSSSKKFKHQPLTPASLHKYRIVLVHYDQLISCIKHHQSYTSYPLSSLLLDGPIQTPLITDFTEDNNGLQAIFATTFTRVIADESQHFSNCLTQLFKTMCMICARVKWCVTGTPIRNSLQDLFSQLKFLGYNHMIHQLEEDKQVIKHHIYEETYEGVNIQLPPSFSFIIDCIMDNNEQELYQYVRTQAAQLLQLFCNHTTSCIVVHTTEATTSGEHAQTNQQPTYVAILAMLVRLRQICVSSRCSKLVSSNIPNKLRTWYESNETSAGMFSCKMNEIIRCLQHIHANFPQDKCILFVNFTSYFHVIQLRMQVHPELPFKMVHVDGSMTTQQREQTLQSFRECAETKVLMMTYKVGSESLNLTEANHMIFVEPWWCPSVLEQAKARIYRTGQTKSTYFYHLLTKFNQRVFNGGSRTIEERMYEVCQQKTGLHQEWMKQAQIPMNIVETILL